ncbi:MAG: Eco57I restriction-modification methylase domain-containing protein [Fibromonadales bacterium]|nr:Eco57I restriction-modification methylase domain-containing protein [Fibromonadales bacterium]
MYLKSAKLCKRVAKIAILQMLMNAKQQLGQFYTKNTGYILQGLAGFVKGKNVVDPFAGAGDLLKWAKANRAGSVTGYDIEHDSLRNPQKYEFVLTNPPYLYQNNMKDKSLLKNSKHTDLYQLSLEKIMDSEEGIAIVPINFLSAENSKYIRELFLSKFEIKKANYFSERVFEDTTYNVIAFYYKKKSASTMCIDFTIYPQKKYVKIKLHKKYNWQIGGEFLAQINACSNKLRICRFEEEDLQPGSCAIKAAYNHLSNVREFNVSEEIASKLKRNIVVLKAIDSSCKICLEDIRKYNLDALVSLKTSRHQIQLLFPETVSVQEQEKIIELFNKELETQRNRYHSLFMTNYRDNGRKRISFAFAYNLVNFLYFKFIKR